MNEADLQSDPSQASGDSLWEMALRRRSLVFMLGIAAMLLACLLTYSWVMARAGFIWDDDHYVTANPHMRSWEGLKNIWVPPDSKNERTQYYPLANTAFWIQYQLFGKRAAGYHIVNVVLHACSAMLLWVLLRRLEVRGAWAAAAVWALHPVQVETVAWITELKNILSTLFYFAAMLVYLRYTELTPHPLLEPRKANASAAPTPSFLNKEWFSLPEDPTRVYALVVFLFACSLLSKSVSATMPAAILLIAWWKHGRIRLKEDVAPLVPLFLMGIGMGVFTAYWEANTIGASGSQWQYGSTWIGEVGARCIIAGRAVWFYLVKLFVPYQLIFNYPRWTVSAGAIWQYVYPCGVVIALLALWMLRRVIGRGPLAGALFFIGTLFPALGFVNVYPMQYSFVADHFQYLACIGIIVVVIAAMSLLIEQLAAIDVLNPAAAPAAVFVLLGALAIRSSRQGMMYESLNTLWRETIKQTGGGYTKSWFASNNYGVLLLNGNQTAAADKWFDHALKLNSKNPAAWFNKGLVAERRGLYDDALKYHRTCLQNQSDYGPARIHVADLLARLGQYSEAIAEYAKIVEDHPDDEQIRVKFGLTLFKAERIPEAINQYDEAIRLNDTSLPAHLNKANALTSVGQFGPALLEYGRVVQLDPKNAAARLNTGNIMAYLQKYNEAAAQFKLAAEYDPNMPEAVHNLGLVYMKQGKYEDAVATFDKLLKMAPNYPKAKEMLDEALDLLAHPEKRPATTQSTTRPQAGPSGPGPAAPSTRP